MRKLNYLVVLFVFVGGLFLQSCNKDEVQKVPEAEMQFVINQTDFEFKTLDDSVPMCQDLSMDYVVFELAGTTYTSPIMFANGKFLTKTVKLDAIDGTYALTSFFVYHDNLPVGPDSQDVMIKAAPLPNSTYHDLMVNKLDLEISVEAFEKAEVIIDVLCYEDIFYDAFGFTWFDMNQVRIERQCVFGDICIPDDYLFEGSPYIQSLYADQENGLQTDMPAIMEVKVYKSTELIRTFSNANWDYPGEGSCLEVYYANDEDLAESFTYEVYVLKPNEANGTMEYQLVGTINFDDEVGGITGDDGVVDFVVGDCNLDDVDYQWAY